jgi:hypothetical protein
MYRTVGWVTLREPEEILFEGVEGPLILLQDRFLLRGENGCTGFRYESVIGMGGSVAGWVLAQRRVRPRVERFMIHHVHQLKATIERRAKQSRVYPFAPCAATRGGHP